jgi:uncharacterized protein (TIGR03905 family)
MTKHIEYQTKGTCSKAIIMDVEDGIITDCRFVGGCPGNTHGVASLVKGMKVEDAIARLEGIKCGMKPTSCPDQLALALKENL